MSIAMQKTRRCYPYSHWYKNTFTPMRYHVTKLALLTLVLLAKQATVSYEAKRVIV